MNTDYQSGGRAWGESAGDREVPASSSHAASICHDLRQHLGALQNLLAVLKSSRELSGASGLTVEAMSEELAAASSMISHELASTRAGPSVVDLAEVAAAAARTLRRRHGVDVTVRTAGRSRVLGREVEIRRAVSNLLDNAHGADPHGVLELAVAPEGNRVAVEVLDGGEGFGSSPVVGGLGLSQVRAAAKEFGGLLLIEDRETGGTRVRLSFPRARTFAS